MRRFESGGSVRYVWDPVVHERHNEDCYFYLLRARDASSHVTLTKELNRLLRREHITSHSIYGIYGYYDALIRLWATETIRRRFIRALRSSPIDPGRDGELVEFRTQSITYSFAGSPNPISQAVVRSLDPQTRLVVEADTEDQWDATPAAEAAFAELQKAGMIHEVPLISGLKVYLVLSRTRSQIGSRFHDEGTRLIAAMNDAGFQSVSLYSGSGSVGDYLVKGIADVAFEDLWEMLAPVHAAASELLLRSMTLPIGNLKSVIESDAIDSLRHRTQAQMDDLHSELCDLAHSGDDERQRLWTMIEVLTSRQQEALLHYYEEIADGFRDSSLFARLMGILRASLLGDVDSIVSELAFITYIERDLRRILPPLLRDVYGELWFAAIEDLLRAAPPEADPEEDIEGPEEDSRRRKFSKLTLHQLFTVAREVSDDQRPVADALAAALDIDWTSHTRTIENLRNDFAHGRLIDRTYFTDFDATWGAQLDRILIAARFSQGLRDLGSGAT